MTKGIGKYQTDKAEKSLMSILKVLSDEKEHRYTEIKEKSGSNDPTLKKYFTEFKELKLVKKRVDITSGKYPYPAYYSINPKFHSLIKIIFQIEQEKKEIREIILNPKNSPLDVLDQINSINNTLILSILENYRENKDISQKLANLILELCVWTPYKILTSYLLEQSNKISDKIDIKELLKRNRTTIRMDKDMLLKISGWNEKQINGFYKKIGHGDLVEE